MIFVPPHSQKAAHILDFTGRLLRNIVWNPNTAMYKNILFTDTMIYAWGIPEFFALMSELGFTVPLLPTSPIPLEI